VQIGNFVEIKEAVIEDGAKANHLAYIGNARLGAGSNFGAGAIICNYDGVAKHRTDIGKGAFIGSNAALVSTVTIGDGAYVGNRPLSSPKTSRRSAGDRTRASAHKGKPAQPLRALKDAAKKKAADYRRCEYAITGSDYRFIIQAAYRSGCHKPGDAS
jgi:bifunctional UDP-N-acetylglucosamine pyrophosphorylase/glucosamine-1-phosphate N-acetyltransferase